MSEVRRLTAEDAAAFHVLRQEAMTVDPDTLATTLVEEQAKSLDFVAGMLVQNTVFGAFLDGKLVGMAGFSRLKPMRERHKGLVWSMFVRRSARGHGFGGRLLDQVIAHARTEVEVLQLVVVSTNAPAVSLYESRGFQRWGLEPYALKLGEGRHTVDAYYWLPLADGLS